MEEILKILETKHYSKQTQDYIVMFIDAFGKIYGDYITKDELARRITRNLDSDIEFSDKMEKNVSGTYNPILRKITISSKVDEKENVIIHELIHCITRYKSYKGISKVGFSDSIKYVDGEFINFGEGITEAVTEFMTQEICTNCNIKLSNNGYTRLMETVKALMKFTGKETLVREILNPDNDINEIIDEQGLNPNSFIYYTDKIRQEELNQKTLLDVDNSAVQYTAMALEELARIYPQANSVEELIQKYEFYKQMTKQLYVSSEYDIYIYLVEDIRRLRMQGIDVSRIAYMMEDEDIQQTCNTDKKIRELLSQKREDAIMNLESVLFDDENDENSTTVIANKVFPYLMYRENSTAKGFPDEFYNLFSVRNYLEEHPEVDYREISFRVFQHSEVCVAYDLKGNIINMFDLANGESMEKINDEFTDIEGRKIHINEDETLCIENIPEDGESTYFQGVLEYMEEQTKGQQKRLEEFEDQQAPDAIINNAKIVLEARKNKIRNLQEEISESKKARQMTKQQSQDQRDER